MRITFVLPEIGLSGGTRVVATYAEQLQQRGHQVCVVCCPAPSICLRQQFKTLLKGQGWQVKDPAHYLDNKTIDCRTIEQRRPIRAADVPDADVVIATWWETAEWVAQFPLSKGVKVYFVQHDESLFENQPIERVKATWRLPMYKITVSQWLADLAHREYGDHAVAIVPDSVDTEQFFALPRGRRSIPTIGLLYSTAGFKGCDISLAAFSLAARNIPHLQLVAFGSGHPSSLLPLAPRTHYHYRPAQALLKDIYAQCDAWLFGSRTEGFGLPILEAMACRTPVIGTPAGAAPDLLAQGGGILVKPEDPEDMARAIEQICRMPDEEWRIRSQLAYTKAISYTWDDATDLFEVALEQAVELSRLKQKVQDLV